MLVAGEIDAAIGAGDPKSDEVRPLIPNASAADAAFYMGTGVYPINHLVVIRNDHLQAEPWIAPALFEAFRTAKQLFLERLRAGNALSSRDERFARIRTIVGDDPLPFGVHNNRTTIEALLDFAVDQRIIPRRFSIGELFAPNTLALE